MIRALLWTALLLGAIGVAGYASAALLLPDVRPSFIAAMMAKSPYATIAHLAGGAIAIVVGALQLNTRLRARYLPLHRWLGRIYIACVAVSGTAGFLLALTSTGGVLAHWGFALMAVVWVTTALLALRAVLARRIAEHREWMIRSYAVTLAAVTLRIYLPLSIGSGYAFDIVYPIIAWLCWVPNLIVAEWYILATRPRRLAT